MENFSEFKWFIEYFALFFIILIIGTLVHELGHFIAAIILGIPAQISYAYTHYFGTITGFQRFWFLMGGPIISWLVASIGFTVILIKYRHMHKKIDNPIRIGQSLSISRWPGRGVPSIREV